MIAGFAYRTYRYRQICSHIEAQYDTEIKTLITACHEWPDPTFPAPDDFRTSENMKRELARLFDAAVFFDVDWSYDSHHGLRSIKHLPEGFRYEKFSRYRVNDYTTLRFATSDSGTKLVLYERWVDGGQTMRHFSFSFRRKLLYEQMRNSAE